MKKHSLALFCILALSACDSSSTNSASPASDSDVGATDSDGGDAGDGVVDTDNGDAGDGVVDSDNGDAGDGVAGSDGGDAGDGVVDSDNGDAGDGVAGSDGGDAGDGVAGSDGGDAGDGVVDSDSGDAGGGVVDSDDGDGDGVAGSGDEAGESSCVPPTHGTIISQGTGTLTDGCIDTGTSAGGSVFDGVLDYNPDDDTSPSDIKGVYLYTQNSNPGYIMAFSWSGYDYHGGSLGFVTGGPGVYYLPFSRAGADAGSQLNGLQLRTASASTGEVNFTEVTWAHASDDVTAMPKLHWQYLSSAAQASSFTEQRDLITLAASGHSLRALTHILAEDVVSQYSALKANGCTPTVGFSEYPVIRFTDATGELGQAWTGRDLNFHSGDDLSRPTYAITIDWNYASQATLQEITSSFDNKAYLWPSPQQISMVNGSCLGQIAVTEDYDTKRQQVLDGELGQEQVWAH